MDIFVIIKSGLWNVISTISTFLKLEFWNGLSSIATVVAASGILIAWRQLRINLQQVNFDAFMKAQDIWTEPEFVESRGKIFERINSGNDKWTPEEEKSYYYLSRLIFRLEKTD